jgi:DNA-binding GntR family transcriptional regulator
MPSFSGLKRKEGVTLGESVRTMLSDRMIGGEFAPGDKLSLRTLADLLGVSMTPVREAVSRLVADHALEVAPNRAVRVPILNIAQFRELTRLRIDIEGAAAHRAATSRDDADIKAMAAHEVAFRTEGQKAKPNLAKVTSSNQKLHFAIYAAAKSPMLVDVIAGLWLKVGPILNLDMRTSPDRIRTGRTFGLHAAAVAAIRSRDSDAARAAVAGDIQSASEFIISRGLLPK